MMPQQQQQYQAYANGPPPPPAAGHYSPQHQTQSPQMMQPSYPQMQQPSPLPGMPPPPPPQAAAPSMHQSPPAGLPPPGPYQSPPPPQQHQPQSPYQPMQAPPPPHQQQPQSPPQQMQQSLPPPPPHMQQPGPMNLPPPPPGQYQQQHHPQQQHYPPGPPPPQTQQPHAPQMHYQPGPPMGYHPPQQAPKLDQHAMPSVAQLVEAEIKTYRPTDKVLKFTAPASLPPLVTTLESKELDMTLQDAGCARPCHIRSTIYAVPTTKEVLDTSGLEFSVVIKPFDDGEVDKKFFTPLSQCDIERCNRCKAYANPFSRNGQCCICNYTTGSVQELDQQKPELYFGSYEFRVTPEYYRNQIAENRRPHIIFAIELTASSRHMVHYVSKHLAKVIKDDFPSDFLYSTKLTPLVGFATYNSKITLYDVLNGGHAYVISDMTSVTECASTSKFLVDPVENFDKIEQFLTSLVDLSNECAEVEQQTVLGPVVEATLKTCLYDTSNNFQGDGKQAPNLKVVPTGKIYLLHSSLPTYGDETTPGRLAAKRNIDDMKRHLGSENEAKVLAPEGKYYKELAQKCINDYASGVELFLFPPHPRAYLNLATLGDLSRLTGTGVINKYHITSLDNFLQDLKFSLRSTVGFDASMRVRTSTGISAVRYIGNFSTTIGSGCNLEMSAVNTSSNFAVQMKYDDKLPENDLVVVQFAMIYTSVCGERRVRVHNLALTTCTDIRELYKSACCDTLVNVMARDTMDKMREGKLNPKAAKEQLTQRTINILAAYRKLCTDVSERNHSQLILPEGLKLLPVYLCGLLKCDAIDGGMEMFPDDKVLAQLNLLGAMPGLSQATIYPRLYYVTACEADDEDNEFGLKAVLERCYMLALEEAQGQCFVLENGYYLFLFFPNDEMGQNFLASVFGQHKDNPDLQWEYRQRDSSDAQFLEHLIERITLERKRALRVSVVRQGKDKLESVFRTFLYEDKKRPDVGNEFRFDNPSYVDTLCYLHTQIRAKISQ